MAFEHCSWLIYSTYFYFLCLIWTRDRFGQMTIADISIVTIVSVVDMIVPVTADQWPKLYHWWYNVMKALPHYEQANEAGLAALKEWVQQSTDFKIKM